MEKVTTYIPCIQKVFFENAASELLLASYEHQWTVDINYADGSKSQIKQGRGPGTAIADDVFAKHERLLDTLNDVKYSEAVKLIGLMGILFVSIIGLQGNEFIYNGQNGATNMHQYDLILSEDVTNSNVNWKLLFLAGIKKTRYNLELPIAEYLKTGGTEVLLAFLAENKILLADNHRLDKLGN